MKKASISAIDQRVGGNLERVDYLGLPNCYRLANRTVEVIVTTDVGPRIVRYGFVGEGNILGECADTLISTELGDWKPWGGHRLWIAPEVMPRSYVPDNSPVEFEVKDALTIRLLAPIESYTGIQKEISIYLDQEGSGARIDHRIINRNGWGIEVSLWALTIMKSGGTAILPQEPYRPHGEHLLPARPLVLWHYTDLSDPRFRIGQKFISVRSDAKLPEPQKIGIANKQGWTVYQLGQTLFVKRFNYEEGAKYPDYGCNNEVFTAGPFIEVESLSPLRYLEPAQDTKHTERWQLLSGVVVEEDEKSAAAAISDLIS